MYALHALMSKKSLTEKTANQPDQYGGWEMGTWSMGTYLDFMKKAGLNREKINPYSNHKRIPIKGIKGVYISYRFSKEEQKKMLDYFMTFPKKEIEYRGETVIVQMDIIGKYVLQFEMLLKKPNLVWYNS
jgi:hypothetical protein